MGIFIGGTEIKDIKIGSTAINKVFIGANQVWSRYLDQQTVTVGHYISFGFDVYGYSSSIGSISDGTCNFKNNASIRQLTYTSGSPALYFMVNGSGNSGFTTMTVDNTNFARTNASFTQYSNFVFWQWSNVSTNPFGTTVGATKTVTWT